MLRGSPSVSWFLDSGLGELPEQPWFQRRGRVHDRTGIESRISLPEHRIEFVEHRIEFVGARDVRKRRLGEWCAISLIEVAFIPVQNCLFKQEASSAFYFDSVLIVRHNIWIFHRSKMIIPFPICAHLLGYLRLYLVPLLAQTQSCRFNNFSCWKGPS